MTNYYTCDQQKSLMNIETSFITDSETPELMEPAYGSFNNPTEDTQTTSVGSISAGNAGSDSYGFMCLSMGIRIVGSICHQFIKTVTWATNFPLHCRNIVDQFEQFCDVMSICSSGVNHNGNTIAIGQHVMLRARFSSVYGAGTGFFAPPTARTVPLSTAQRVKSIMSALRNRSRVFWCMVAHTPAPCQDSVFDAP